mmetsp:Transcript_91220/g.190782  ORF Transcript_91220/g.190782 Transcript_91220/m.190782 type:complete len:267 (+) Transcript_91220:343-1143(+)
MGNGGGCGPRLHNSCRLSLGSRYWHELPLHSQSPWHQLGPLPWGHSWQHLALCPPHRTDRRRLPEGAFRCSSKLSQMEFAAGVGGDQPLDSKKVSVCTYVCCKRPSSGSSNVHKKSLSSATLGSVWKTSNFSLKPASRSFRCKEGLPGPVRYFARSGLRGILVLGGHGDAGIPESKTSTSKGSRSNAVSSVGTKTSLEGNWSENGDRRINLEPTACGGSSKMTVAFSLTVLGTSDGLRNVRIARGDAGVMVASGGCAVASRHAAKP